MESNDNRLAAVITSFSSPEPTILLACGRDRELWLVPKQEVLESRTSASSTQTQKFETTVFANGYKNILSLRLRIFRYWPELSIPKGSWALATRMSDNHTKLVSHAGPHAAVLCVVPRQHKEKLRRRVPSV